MLSFKRAIPLQWILVIGYIISVYCSWSYGNSYALYAGISILLMFFVYLRFPKKNYCIRSAKQWITFVFVSTVAIGFVNGDIKSSVMTNTSLLLPFAISTLNINYNKLHTQVIIASILNLMMVSYASVSMGGEWNSNSLAFMVYCGISTAFVWYKFAPSFFSKACAMLFLLYSSTFLFLTGSRNACMVIILCGFLLVIPAHIMKQKTVFRTMYLVAIFSTVFAEQIMSFVFGNDNIMASVTSYTTQFSEKAWGMDTHYTMILFVKDRFLNLDFFTQLMGSGIKMHHCHNLFYQCLFFYGCIGTTIIYGFYIYLFEIGYKLFSKYDDILTFACCIILTGHFLMQVGEVYMLGSEGTILSSLIPAGIILQRYKNYHENSYRNTLLQA